MRRRSSGFFIAVNMLVSVGVALGAIALFTLLNGDEGLDSRARPTIIIVVTATPDPNQPLSAVQLQGTVDAQAGTLVAAERGLADAQAALALAEAESGRGADDVAQAGPTRSIPTRDPEAAADSSDDAPITQSTPASPGDNELPTIPPQLIPALPDVGANPPLAAPSGADDGCQRYFVQAGDTASTIATRFEVSLTNLFILNNLTDQSILQIGDELIIPGEDCQPEIPPTDTPAPEPTFNLAVATPSPSPSPTIEVEVSGESQIEIVDVANPGDITTEQVELRNLGGELTLTGWTLEDADNNVYAFPDVRIVPNGVIRILSRSGTNTPGFLFWNLNEPVWEMGELVTLRDADDLVQAVFTVGGEIIDFGTPSSDDE